jgi:hypothetical protein
VLIDGGAKVETRPIPKEFLIATAMSALFVGSLTHYSSHRGSQTASPSLPAPFALLSEALSESAGLSTYTKSPVPTQVEPIENGATLAETSAMSTPNSVHATAQSPDAVFDTQNKNPQLERRKLIARNRVFTCYTSPSTVRHEHPQAWPSWTLRALGHKGTRCWYPGTHPTAQDHPK